MRLDRRFLCVWFLKAKSLLNPSSTASRRIGDLRLVLTDRPLMKLDFAGLKSSLFLLLLYVRRGGYRLLILDGYGSHLSPNFDQIYKENKIIPIYIPPHSSYLLQPLDIGCFTVLKRLYSRIVEIKIRNGINYIDKFDFLEVYPLTRTEAFKTWLIAELSGLGGLLDLVRSNALIDEAYFCNCI